MRRASASALLLVLAAGAGAARPAPAARPVAAAKKPAASPAARAVAIQIRALASGKVERFYATRGFWPLWAQTGKIGPEANALIEMLASADLDGLKPAGYAPDALREMVTDSKSGGPVAVARAELALSGAFARYVTEVRRPVDTGMTYVEPALRPRRLKPETVLRAAALTTSFRDYVTGMGWMSPHYLRLRRLLALAKTTDAPDAERARLRLNLDRARLLPGPWMRHIVVDAASARLFYYQGGREQGMMKVVVGTPATPTPMMAGVVRYAILNPYWNVPTDLAQRRIAPKMLAGASLASLRYQALSDWSASATPLDPRMIDWHAVASGEREVRLRQLPGGDNAMGKVKFMFPNDLGIYLHDTPDKALMRKPDRHFSNGCIRLEDAARLGRWLLGRPLPALARKPEQDVALADPVPVYVTYFTATPTEAGFAFIDDVYGRDGKTAL